VSFADLIAKKSGNGTEDTSAPEAGLQPSPAGSLEKFIQRHGHITESYWFYDHTVELRFNTEEHKYYRVGELGNFIAVPGVTTVCGIVDKSHMLVPWASKMCAQKMLRLMPTEEINGTIRVKPLTLEEFTTLVLEAKSAHKDKLEDAGDVGHASHKCLEDSINHALQTDPEHIVRSLIALPEDERAINAANSALAWMSQHRVRWQETEKKIYSRLHDYAGTADGLAICDSCQNKTCCPVPFTGRLCLIDWKSSNSLKIDYLLQTAAYVHAKQEELGITIADRFVLRLGKSEEEAGKFESWHSTVEDFADDFAAFLGCLSLVRLVDSVEERMKTQKGSIRALRKEQKETAKSLQKEQEKLQKALDKAEAKRLREEEKVKIKLLAKAERERLKAEKKAGQYSPLTEEIKAILEPAHVQRPSNAVVEEEENTLLPYKLPMEG